MNTEVLQVVLTDGDTLGFVAVILAIFGLVFLRSFTRPKSLREANRFLVGLTKDGPASLSDESLAIFEASAIGHSDAGAFVPDRRGDKYVFHRLPDVLCRVPPPSQTWSPALLTAVGILGTFWGISSGLVEAGELIGENLTDTMEGVRHLVDAMKTAFLTSLCGLSCAAVMMLRNAWVANRRHARLEWLKSRFRRIAVIEPPGLALAQLGGRDTAAATQAQLEAAASLAHSAQLLATSASGFNAEKIGEMVGAELRTALDGSLLPAFTRMATAMEAVRDRLDEQNQRILEELTTALEDRVVAPLAKKVELSATTSERVAKTVELLHDDLGGIAAKLGDAVQTIDTFQTDTLRGLERFQASMHETLTEFRTETEGVLKSVAEEVSLTVRQAGNEAAETMHVARDELTSTFKNIDGTMKAVRTTVETELERFRQEYQERVAEFLEQQSQILDETLRQHPERIAAVVQELDASFRAEAKMRAELQSDLSSSVGEVRGLLEDVSALVGAEQHHLLEAARALNRGMHHMEARYESLDKQLRETLKSSHTELTRYLEEAQSTYRAAFREFDDVASEILGGVAGAAQQVVAASEGLAVAQEAQ